MHGVDSIFGKFYSIRDIYDTLTSDLLDGQQIGIQMSRKTFQYIRRRLNIDADYMIMDMSFTEKSIHLPIVITNSVHYKDIKLCVIQPIDLPEEPYDFD